MNSSPLAAALRVRNWKLVDLARAMGVDKATVSRWAKSRIPAERVLEIEKITGIPRHQLRSDLYPEEVIAA